MSIEASIQAVISGYGGLYPDAGVVQIEVRLAGISWFVTVYSMATDMQLFPPLPEPPIEGVTIEAALYTLASLLVLIAAETIDESDARRTVLNSARDELLGVPPA